MASLSTYRTGWAIQWKDGGKRRTLYPGSMTRKQAGTVLGHVDALVIAKKSRTAMPERTASWLASIDPAMRRKLYTLALIDRPAEVQADSPADMQLAEFLKKHIRGRAGKASTKYTFERCETLLLAHFGKERSLRSITLDNVMDFRSWMLEKGNQRSAAESGLSENTVRKMCSIARSFFKSAKKLGLVDENHFADADVPKSVRENRSRDFFVTRDMAEAVIDACPDHDWKLIVALARYGGLRCPSETLSLRWVDILWDRDRINVTAPKTAHHEGKGVRVIPIFPELRPYLDAAFHAAPDGAEFCITRYRGPESNLGTQFTRIIRKAGLKPWAKPFHNMRASRETELTESFPIKTVCSWIGNSPAVAMRNYLTVPEEHFDRAASSSSIDKVLQNVLRSVSGTGGIEREQAGDEIVRDDRQAI